MAIIKEDIYICSLYILVKIKMRKLKLWSNISILVKTNNKSIYSTKANYYLFRILY